MQTKKKLPTVNAAREHASPRVCRPQKKASENVQVAEKKITELITSSARKQRFSMSSPSFCCFYYGCEISSFSRFDANLMAKVLYHWSCTSVYTTIRISLQML